MEDIKRSVLSFNIPVNAPTKFEKDITPWPVYIFVQD